MVSVYYSKLREIKEFNHSSMHFYCKAGVSSFEPLLADFNNRIHEYKTQGLEEL